MLRSLGCIAAVLLALPVLAQQVSISGTPDAHATVVGEVFSSDAGASGSVVLAGGNMRLLSGSSVKAGAHPASVRLARGGELRVCPDTGVAVNATSSRDIMWSLSAGSLEAHYSLPSSDVVLTPDFRIVLAGPGELHVAVAADFRGNGCVKSLAGNTVPVLVAELMGSGTFQLSPGEQVYFRDGSVNNPSFRPLMTCGCPGAGSLQRGVQTATPAPPAAPKPVPSPPPPATTSIAPAETQAPPKDAVSAESLPLSKPGDTHVEVEAPLVFQAREVAPAPEPAAIASLPLRSAAVFDPLLKNEVVPPSQTQAAEKQKKSRGFFGRIGSFFAAMFRGK